MDISEILTPFTRKYADTYPDMLPASAVRFPSLAAARAAVAGSGSHYFDRDAIRFFRAQSHGMIGGRFAVESICDGTNPREYRVTWWHKIPGEIFEAEHSISFPTLAEAREAARTLARLV